MIVLYGTTINDYSLYLHKIWNTVPESKRREIHAINREWLSTLLDGKCAKLLFKAGEDWCEENGFQRVDFYHMFTKELTK